MAGGEDDGEFHFGSVKLRGLWDVQVEAFSQRMPSSPWRELKAWQPHSSSAPASGA